MIDRSKRQIQRIVKRYLGEGIHGLRFRSRRPYAIVNKTPVEIENRIIKVRKATGFGSEQLANIVNEFKHRTQVWSANQQDYRL